MILHARALRALTIVCAGVLASFTAAAQAQTADNFYKGKTVKIVLPTAPGGSTSLYGLLIAEHLQRHIPGNPVVTTEYRIGAGGIVAANYVYNAAPKDGTVITMLISGLLAEDTQPDAVKFKAAKFRYIGRAADLPRAFVAWHAAGINTIDDARKRQVALGSSGAGALTSIHPLLVNDIYGTKFKIVNGYGGAGTTYLALERGEIDATTVAWEGLVAQHADWLRDGKIKVLATMGSRQFTGYETVPKVESLAKTAEDRELLAYSVHYADVGQALAAPAEIPEDRLQILRRAFDAMVKDPAFIATTKAKNVEIEPMTGEDLQAFVDKAAQRSPKISARMRALVNAE
ncbi:MULTISPECIES: tripartite tricarboxylate transporter substrate-binding protein [unclassified Beijerinckia]|uniref:Bug family tripartite tricarboxylate transporter substrate binding protein n=1 Tax=unclassified Beijerinckia TaxID=2638183 RepID=UPI00089BAE06|nr:MULTISPECIES: tripartite tricarboxylate transporter substrate-binding protein [unclassified Beijerinckia]MDH7795071.1 tripartite-type tricarboxylate transporter receptor subunit TctC [Beijerinckia sp. GAS462]SEB86438.1 Tripartite-type tricarboxylate transporter, receptor component TctC [Beijerinckia sp. 28-YEA-48]